MRVIWHPPGFKGSVDDNSAVAGIERKQPASPALTRSCRQPRD